MQETERPSIGVAAIVEKDGLILVGKDTRKGDAVFGVPGGHWESGETLRDCAAREVQEESGVICTVGRLVSIHDFYRADKRKSYVSIGFHALYVSGDVRDLSAEGRMDWSWVPPQEALSLNLFAPDAILLQRYLSGVIYD